MRDDFCCRTALQLQSNVTDELVGELAPLRYLRDLSLRGCTALTGVPATGFGRLTMLSQLRCLDISNCTGLQVPSLANTASYLCVSLYIFACQGPVIMVTLVGLFVFGSWYAYESCSCGACRPAQWRSSFSCAGSSS